MRKAARIRTFALLLAAGTAQGAVTHTLLPWQAQAGMAFDLMLDGDYACNVSFSHESTYVSQDRMVLAFVASENPAVKCAAPTQPSGPQFRIPALAAGAYPVYSQALAPCMVGQPPCELHVEPVPVGTLKVTSGPAYDTGWFLHPRRVGSGRDVRVSLLNLGRGSCENEFRPARDTLRFQTLDLLFHTLHYRRVCKTSVRPFGPEFSLGDLAPGSYRVVGYDLPECTFQNPPCVAATAPEAVLMDTLVVAGTSALGPLPERPAASAPRLRRLPGGLGLIHPVEGRPGLGLRVERLVTPDGRRVRTPGP